MPQLSTEKRNLVITMKNQGFTQKAISEVLNCGQGSVSKILKKYKDFGSTSTIPGRGRKEKLNKCQKLKIKRLANSNPTISATEIYKNIADQGVVSKWTIYRYLRSIGLYSRIGKFSSVSSRIHRRKRIIFCKKYLCWTEIEWSNVIFTDETSILLAPRRRTIVKRPRGARNNDKYVIKHVYSEKRSAMFWGCICADGFRFIKHVSGSMNSTKYIETIKNTFPTFPPNRLMQQDRAPPHVSQLSKLYFAYHHIPTLEPWPPSSPDLNPIENLWSLLKKKVHERGPTSIPNLIEIVKDEFHKLPLYYIKTLCLSMKNRVSEVLKAKGRGSKY